MKQQVVMLTAFWVTTSLMLSGCGLVLSPSAETDDAPTVLDSAEMPQLAAETLSDDITVYRIDSDASVVRFELDEELRGEPKTVVGETNLVAGEVGLNWQDVDSAVVSPIQIDARGFETDDPFRNRAIANQILQTTRFEFVTFVPSDVAGLPDTIATGDTVDFDITGELTIRDTTMPVTFAVTASAETPQRLAGSASATIQREDFDLWIPAATGVAEVEDEVELTIEFVAVAASPEQLDDSV